MTTQKESWRDTILATVAREGELSADSLHEAAEGDEDLEEALSAADALVGEGLLVKDEHEVWTRNPTGPWGGDVPEA